MLDTILRTYIAATIFRFVVIQLGSLAVRDIICEIALGKFEIDDFCLCVLVAMLIPALLLTLAHWAIMGDIDTMIEAMINVLQHITVAPDDEEMIHL